MQIIFPIVFSVAYSALLSLVPSSITALLMMGGKNRLGFIKAFSASYLPWFAAFFCMNGLYLSYALSGKDRHDVPGVLILVFLVAGGWGAVASVRAARNRIGA